MSEDKFSFVPEEHPGGQFTDSSPGQKFMNPFDPIFECIQNSIDASLDEKKTAKLNIHYQKVYLNDLDFFDNNFKNHIKNSKKISDRFILDNDVIELLVMEDFNTTGITGDPEKSDDQTDTGQPNNYFYMNQSFGLNQKLNDARLGGSEGEGTQAFNLNSDISTFFYYSVDVTSNNRGAFFGISYLGGRKLDQINYMPFGFFGKKKLNPKFVEPTYNCYPVTEEKEISRLVSLFKLKRKKNDPGTSIIIPFYKKKGIEDKKLLIANIIDVYRATILRGELEVIVDNEEINQSSIAEVSINGLNPKNKTLYKVTHKNLISEYYNFLKSINDKESIDLEFSHNGKNHFEKKELVNFNKILESFNSREIVKIRINFSVTKINKEASSVSNRFLEKHTYVDFYIKKYPVWADLEESYNDVLRGKMALHKLRKNMQCFYLMDFQQDEAKLLLKNAEVANHSDIAARNPKLDNNYKNYSNTISFFKNFPKDLYTLLSSSEDISDFDITQDLFKINEVGQGIRNTDEILDEEEDENSEEFDIEKNENKIPQSLFKVPDIIVPPIFPSLKYYERNHSIEKGKVVYRIVGVKYLKEDVLKKLEDAEKYVKDTEQIERKNFKLDELKRMDKTVGTFKKRILDYKDFLTRGCTFYPRRIEIDAAFDGEGMGNKSFRRYCIEDFDFADEKKFNLEFTNVKKDYANENKITLVANNENFEFKIKGFDEKNIEDIRWRDRSYSIKN